jgi:hypothetical protein
MLTCDFCTFTGKDASSKSCTNQQEEISDFRFPLNERSFNEIPKSEHGFCEISTLIFIYTSVEQSMKQIFSIITDQLFCVFKNFPTDEIRRQFRSKCIAFTGMSTPCNDEAETRLMQNKDLGIEIRTFLTTDRGYGIKTTKNVIPKGTPIIEYVGKVVTHKIYRTCMERMYKHDSNIYAVVVDDNWVIDAHKFGNLARFVNHSCQPNCIIEAWHAESSNPKFVITAKRDVQPGEELTYNYNTRPFDAFKTTFDAFKTMVSNCECFQSINISINVVLIT